MYLHNKYTKWYYSIIEQALSRPDSKEYLEKHHIIPKSLGGTNEKINLVKLTPKEHYICHLLLTKMVIGEDRRKMWYASYMMMKGTRRYKPSARMYYLAKNNMVQANKNRPGPNLGKKMSEEQKLKISIAQKGIPKGPLTEDHKKKLSKPKSEEHKRKLSITMKGKTYGHRLSEETKLKMSLKAKGRKPKLTVCENCGITLSVSNYQRWHGTKCKHKQ